MLRSIVLLILSFCFSVIAFAAPQPLDKTVALVNDGLITERELLTEIQSVRQQMQANDMSIPAAAELREQVLERLIDKELQIQLTTRLNVDIESEDLDHAVQDIAERNGMTMRELRAEIEAQGMSFSDYRENIRREMLISMLQQRAVAADINITGRQVDDYLENFRDQLKADQEYHVRNLLIPLASRANDEEVAHTEQVAAQVLRKINAGIDFDAVIAEFPEVSGMQLGDLGWRQVKAFPAVFSEVVAGMAVGDVKGPVKAGNGFHLLKVEAVRGGEFDTMVMLTQARHILLQPNEDLSEEETVEKLQEIRQAVLDGKCFSRYAREYSQDPGSAEQGGDLGWVGPGELVAPFEQAMDSLELGEMSDPVVTQFGYHLIQVLDRKEADAEAQYKEQVRQALFRLRFDENVQIWLGELRDQAFVEIIDVS